MSDKYLKDQQQKAQILIRLLKQLAKQEKKSAKQGRQQDAEILKKSLVLH